MFSPLQRAQVSFELGEEIGGEGRNSRTYKAHDPQLNAGIVIKQIPKKRSEDPEEDLAMQESYFNESRALYASAHPNVVQVHYACEDDNHVYVAMPLYAQGSLKKLINSRYLMVREIAMLGCQILSGLHNVHSKGLIHFDVKPDNVLLSDRRDALLTDFGLAEHFDDAGYATPANVYLRIKPPEAITHAEYDRRYDIYQFGITLLCMCNGEAGMLGELTAFQTEEAFEEAVLAGTFPQRKVFLPHIPAKLRSIVTRCLEVDVAERYQSALAVANDLASLDEKMLDWLYEPTAEKRVWIKAINGTTIRVEVDALGSSVVTKAVGDGKAKRQVAGAKVNLTEPGVAKLLRQKF